ncbi:TetR/AcrR family transcriptional regulator [Mucilaginibacter sp. SMC90]|uniref:TetR/AcrR family transcriptional regulator n=1 Tax=Mucilaginibacter sp. SMC90 TaxID=2929803 RepID=UPI001FB2BD38|nr:TetR/AcrR family transcriptional regulator [Mucilaginibacter sp. SMC90]UOE52148.1 TetR/AcrR family transcriptional regulator [Mucilaginibacter sp. SMC90]
MKFIPRSESTRQRIVELTAELINKKGLLGTSVSDLEKATGMTRGSIYGNFPNKDAVALAVFDYNWERKRKLLFDGADSHSSYKSKLLSQVLLHHPSARTPFTPGGCPLLNTVSEADDTNDHLRSKAAAALISWTKNLTEIVEKGIEANEFKANTDCLATALQIISIIEGASLFFRSTQDMKYVNSLVEAAKRIVDNICV